MTYIGHPSRNTAELRDFHADQFIVSYTVKPR